MSTKKAAVVMQTDFTKDISVCTMQGVCMMVDPELRVFDNTHEIKNFDTYQASTALSYVVNRICICCRSRGRNRSSCVCCKTEKWKLCSNSG